MTSPQERQKPRAAPSTRSRKAPNRGSCLVTHPAASKAKSGASLMTTILARRETRRYYRGMARRVRRGASPPFGGTGTKVAIGGVVAVAAVFGIGAGFAAAVAWLVNRAKLGPGTSPQAAGLGDGVVDAPPYKEAPNTLHTNKDGTQCLVWSPSFCMELSTCAPGEQHVAGDPNKNVTECYPVAPATNPDGCEQGTTLSPFTSFCFLDALRVPERSLLPPGTKVSWSPPGDSKPGRMTGEVLGADVDPGVIHWDGIDGTSADWQVIWGWLQSAFPADDQGNCSGQLNGQIYPLPTVEAGWSFAPCVRKGLLNTPLDLTKSPPLYAEYQRLSAKYQQWLATGNAQQKTVAQSRLNGSAPFLTFTNWGRQHLNQKDVTVGGQKGTIRNDGVGLYYGPATGNKLAIANMSYFDKDWNIGFLGLNDLHDVLFATVQAVAHVVVDGVLVPVAEALYDAVKAIACNAAGEGAALAVGVSQGGVAGGKTAVALYQTLCGATPPAPPAPASTFPWGWVAAGAGVVAIGGLGYAAFRGPRKKSAEAA